MPFDARAAKLLSPGSHLTIDDCPGLRLEATASTRIWTYRYKSPVDNRMRQVKIGTWPAKSPAAAIAEWENLRRVREERQDPGLERRTARVEAKAAFEPGASGTANQPGARHRGKGQRREKQDQRPKTYPPQGSDLRMKRVGQNSMKIVGQFYVNINSRPNALNSSIWRLNAAILSLMCLMRARVASSGWRSARLGGKGLQIHTVSFFPTFPPLEHVQLGERIGCIHGVASGRGCRRTGLS